MNRQITAISPSKNDSLKTRATPAVGFQYSQTVTNLFPAKLLLALFNWGMPHIARQVIFLRSQEYVTF